jgi:hypothetical protein
MCSLVGIGLMVLSPRRAEGRRGGLLITGFFGYIGGKPAREAEPSLR